MMSLHITQSPKTTLLEKDSYRQRLNSLSARYGRVENGFDPFKTPPDIQMAINHGKAKRVYKHQDHKHQDHKQQDPKHQEPRCPCCGLTIAGELIPLSSPLKNLYHLGSGYALYFKLIKHCIILLGVIFAVSGFFNLITNRMGQGCVPEDSKSATSYCVQGFIISYTIANKRDMDTVFTIQRILNLLAVVAVFVFFQWIRLNLKNTTRIIDSETITPSDFTLQVTGIPTNLTDEEIITWIESLGDAGNPIKVRKVNRTYDISNYIRLYKQKDMLISRALEEHDHVSRYVIEDEMEEVDSKIKNLQEKDLKLTNRAFISLENQDQVRFILNKSQTGIMVQFLTAFKRRFERHDMKFDGASIKKAPEPTDIIWENQGVDENENLKRRLWSDIWGALLIFICFVIVVFISFGQSRAIKTYKDFFRVKTLSGAASLMIVLMNSAIAYATIFLSRKEKNSTYTTYFTRVARRLCVSMFINTAFTTLFAKLVSIAFTPKDEEEEDDFNFYKSGGLLENIFFVFMTSAVLTPLFTIVRPSTIKKWYKQRKIIDLGEANTITQQKAHEYFELNEIDLSYKNSLLVKTVFVSAFFAPAIPISLVIAIIALTVVYWTDKYVLLRKTSLPISLGHDLNSHMLSVLEWTGFMFALGNLVFHLTLENMEGEKIFSKCWLIVSVTFILGLLHLFFKVDYLNFSFLSHEHDPTATCPYDVARVKFATDYSIENPATSRVALQEFLDFMKKKKEAGELGDMTMSQRKGAFNALKDSQSRDMVKSTNLSESALRKKTKELDFLQGYASRVFQPNMSLSRQKFEKDRNIILGEIIAISEEDLLNFDNSDHEGDGQKK